MRFGPSRYAISRRCCCRCQQKAAADENDPYCDHAGQIETDTCHHVSCSPSTLGLSHSFESNRLVNLWEAVRLRRVGCSALSLVADADDDRVPDAAAFPLLALVQPTKRKRPL